MYRKEGRIEKKKKRARRDKLPREDLHDSLKLSQQSPLQRGSAFTVVKKSETNSTINSPDRTYKITSLPEGFWGTLLAKHMMSQDKQALCLQ